MKSITLLTQFFPPETGAAANRAGRLLEYMYEHGIEAKVITWFPHYPSRILFKEYKGRFLVNETVHGIKIMRFKPIIAKKLFKRMIAEIWLGFCSLIGGLIEKRTSYIYVSTPSIMLVYFGWLLAKLKRNCLIVEIRDLTWNYAFVNNSGQLNFLGRLIQRSIIKIAKGSALVVVTNQIQKEFLLVNNIPDNKIFVLYNGFREEELLPYQPKVAKNNQKDSPFIVLYTGLVGLPQGLDVLIKAAKLTQEYNIIYWIVGDGLEKEYLIDLVQQLQLKNVEFYASVPKKDLGAFYNAADCLFAHLRGNGQYDSALPSKLIDYMVAGRPVLFAGRGEGKLLIEKAACGITIEPDSPENIAKAVLEILGKPNNIMGKRGYDYAIENFNCDLLYGELLNILYE